MPSKLDVVIRLRAKRSTRSAFQAAAKKRAAIEGGRFNLSLWLTEAGFQRIIRDKEDEPIPGRKAPSGNALKPRTRRR